MREFGTIYGAFWANEELRSAGDDARLLAAYLLTSPHTTSLGAFRLPEAYACEDIGWVSERFRNGLETLSGIGFLKYDVTTKWVWICKFLTFNRPANPNIMKAIVRQAEGIPESVSFKSEILFSVNGSERVSELLGNTPSPSPSLYPSQKAREEIEIADVAIPLSDGTTHEVTLAEVAEFEQAYPAVDVMAELRKARAWCVANPAQRKTRRGVGKFLNGWLSRTADKAAPPKPAPPLRRPEVTL